MKTATLMQHTITGLAEKFEVDLTQPGAALQLELDGFMPLSLECIGPSQVAVCHFFMQEGDLMADPEIVFFTGYKEWVPVEITQAPLGVWRRYAELCADASAISKLNPSGVAELADFANQWARNLREQGWLKAGRRRA